MAIKSTLIKDRPLSDKWLKAAVVGSLWATIEIIIGSLLHNIRLPMAGSVLSFITVFLLIAFFQLWPQKGIIIRAGLICALMKSVSPSAIILGPMIGILSEAILLEMAIVLFGRNLFALMLGGALAVFSALAQKAISWLLLYGFGIVNLLENMLLFASEQLNISGLSPLLVLWLIIGIYLLSGMLAAALGYRTGRQFLAQKSVRGHLNESFDEKGSGLFAHSAAPKHSLLLLGVILFLVIAGMWFIAKSPLIRAIPYTLISMAFFYVRYGPSMRYLKKPVLWLQLALIILFSSLFWEGFSFQQPLSTEGAITGVKMSMRALLIMGGFAALGVEIKNPIIRNLLYNKGFRNLYLAVELAFTALPGVLHVFTDQTRKIFGYRRLTLLMLGYSDALLSHFASRNAEKSRAFIISGPLHSGKTTFTEGVLTELKKYGINMVGFLSKGNTNDASRSAYQLQPIGEGSGMLLCSSQPIETHIRFGRFYFNQQAIDAGNQILREGIEKNAELFVIDEIGPLEINNKGWAPSIDSLSEAKAITQLWVVRENLIMPVIRKWHLGKAEVFLIHENTPKNVALKILQEMGLSDPKPADHQEQPPDTA